MPQPTVIRREDSQSLKHLASRWALLEYAHASVRAALYKQTMESDTISMPFSAHSELAPRIGTTSSFGAFPAAKVTAARDSFRQEGKSEPLLSDSK